MLMRILVLTPVVLAMGACAMDPNTSAVNWNRPYQPLAGPPPTFSHDLAIANPPYPRDVYGDYMDEPTRFEFRPRNVIYEETPDNGAASEEQGGYQDFAGGYDMGGGE
jgi:hypothetical protein